MSSFTYHTKQLSPWPESSASRVVIHSQLSACEGFKELFEGNASACRCLTSLRNKPQQKQLRQLSALIPTWIVSSCVLLSFYGEKCVLLLCVWKLTFLISGHKCNVFANIFSKALDAQIQCSWRCFTFICVKLCNIHKHRGFIADSPIKLCNYVNLKKIPVLHFCWESIGPTIIMMQFSFASAKSPIFVKNYKN